MEQTTRLRRIEVDSAHLSAVRSFSDRTELASLLESDRRGEVEACLWQLQKSPEGRLIEDIQAEIHGAISRDGGAVISGIQSTRMFCSSPVRR